MGGGLVGLTSGVWINGTLQKWTWEYLLNIDSCIGGSVTMIHSQLKNEFVKNFES